jgi:hypothetical protein
MTQLSHRDTPLFLTVPVTSDKFTLRLHGSNSVNPSGWRDAFGGKSLLYDEAARLTVLLRITAVDALEHKSRSVGIDQLLIAGAHLPAIINQRGEFPI